MKLKDIFIMQKSDGEQIMAATGSSGFARSNAIVAFIVNCLKKETTREAIVDTMCTHYDVTREKITESVDNVINKLCSMGEIDD